MHGPTRLPNLEPPEPSNEERLKRKHVADRRVLLRHVDWILRPPTWVYDEIEQAIDHANEGRLDATVESRDGHRYTVSELVERWELDDELLEVYRRSADDPAYDQESFGLAPG